MVGWTTARRLLRIVNEGHEIGAGSDACRAHVVPELGAIIGAPVGIFVIDASFVRGGRGPLVAAHGFGIDESLASAVAKIAEDRCANPLIAALIAKGPGARRTVAMTRRDALASKAWYRSEYYGDLLAPAGCDDGVAAARGSRTPGRVSGFKFLRARGDRPFSERDRALLELFTAECAGVMHASAEARLRKAQSSAAARWSLTAREAEVLLHVVLGEPNKVIASKLGCAPKTVEVHVSAILKKAGAESRSQLAARLWRDG